MMLDFTSSCYLGIDHSSQCLRPWSQLTTGKPAALHEPPLYRQVANKIANLQGMEAGAIAKSTLHLFWDLFGIFGQEQFMAFVDADAYPIAQWGIERFAGLGNEVVQFKHHSPSHLCEVIENRLSFGEKPLIVTDSWCTHCGSMAPLKAYLQCARTYGGLLIIDDTQALGIFGKLPSPSQSYGSGGGGSLQYLGIGSPEIILVSSLAKAFGVPIAAISGHKLIIDRFKAVSETRVHCSPPSLADISAAMHSLIVNQEKGDLLRQKLFERVCYFKQSMQKIGVRTQSDVFPLQKILLNKTLYSNSLYSALKQSGITAIPVSSSEAKADPNVKIAMTSNHSMQEIDSVVNTIRILLQNCSLPEIV